MGIQASGWTTAGREGQEKRVRASEEVDAMKAIFCLKFSRVIGARRGGHADALVLDQVDGRGTCTIPEAPRGGDEV